MQLSVREFQMMESLCVTLIKFYLASNRTGTLGVGSRTKQRCYSMVRRLQRLQAVGAKDWLETVYGGLPPKPSIAQAESVPDLWS